MHILGWLLKHQHLIHAVVINMRGPEEPLFFNGSRVRTIIPISLVRGNVTVAFSVLSYAGSLATTSVADAERVPDLPCLTHALQEEFAAMS